MNDKLTEENVSISTIYRKMCMWQNRYSAAYGLSAAQMPVVMHVCGFGTIAQQELVSKLAMDKSVVAKTIGNLIEAGFLERTVNPRDRRGYLISPTEKAMAAYPHLIEKGQAWLRYLTEGMSDEEKAQFSALLKKAAVNAERLTDEA